MGINEADINALTHLCFGGRQFLRRSSRRCLFPRLACPCGRDSRRQLVARALQLLPQRLDL